MYYFTCKIDAWKNNAILSFHFLIYAPMSFTFFTYTVKGPKRIGYIFRWMDTGSKPMRSQDLSYFQKSKKILHSYWLRAVSMHSPQKCIPLETLPVRTSGPISSSIINRCERKANLWGKGVLSLDSQFKWRYRRCKKVKGLQCVVQSDGLQEW